jgi:FixJ family two-component response regulator
VNLKTLPPPQDIDAVLLDDDTLVHRTWNLVARQKNKSIKTYLEVKAFLADIDNIPKETPIYFDSHLGQGHRGEDLIKHLSSLGYRNLTLATGCEPSQVAGILSKTPGFRGIQDKSPPW